MRKLWAVSATVSTLAVITMALLHLPPVRRYFLNAGSEYLRRHLQVDLQASELDYNLFRLTFTLRNISFRTTEPSGAPPFLSASRVYLNLPASALIGKKFNVEEAVLDDVRLNIIVDEKGKPNIPPGMEREREESGTLPDMLIDFFEATGSEFVYEDRRYGIVRLGDWRLSVDGSPATREHAIRFRILQPGEI
ncbi:MAG: hypothetical protein JXR49_12560, partial [Acidobacteria bacterium]|nr:hypothetical protein [Acidobacteriota bacterium]